MNSSTTTNQLQLTIPDELKGVDLQIIILPRGNGRDETIEFFSDDELKTFMGTMTRAGLDDNEDYSKW